MAQKQPIYRTRKFQYMVIESIVVPALCKGVSTVIKHYWNKKKAEKEAEVTSKIESKKIKQRQDVEILKSELRQKEAAQKHQYAMEYENMRHKNKMEEILVKTKEENPFAESDEHDDWQPLPSQNVGQLVNTPLAEDARIKYLGCTYIQNRDIFLLYGPPGIGKSHEVVDLVAEITNGTSSRVVVPFKEQIHLPYKALYYDKEPDDNEWKEKFSGRDDLTKIERITCRDLNAANLIKDVKCQIAISPMTSFVIVVDPITNFDIKPGETHQFVNQLANIQETELARGRNITFILVAHAVKDPKGKYLSDVGGSKFWGESVKTVVSFMPYGENECLRKLTFDKTKNGKEVTRGTTFIFSPENTPHRHHSYDEALTNEYRAGDTCTLMENNSPISVPKMPKRTGKLARISEEDAEFIFDMHQVQGISFDKIAKSPIGTKYNLLGTEVSRLINDMKGSRA